MWAPRGMLTVSFIGYATLTSAAGGVLQSYGGVLLNNCGAAVLHIVKMGSHLGLRRTSLRIAFEVLWLFESSGVACSQR